MTLKTQDFETALAFLGTERRMHYSLEGFQKALSDVGHPEKSVQSIVISGTNGKGSTALLVSSALSQAGYSVGTYLSPHLQSPRERLLGGGQPVSETAFESLLRRHKRLAEKHALSYFEFLTLIYFVWAAEQKFEFSVLEVGLGGRLDATNVTEPIACAITSIDWDHQEILGDSLEKILAEKMGTLRKDSLVFTGIRQPELLKSLESYCDRLDTIYYHARELRTTCIERDWRGQQVEINGFPFFLTNPAVGALENAATAFLLLRIVFPKIPIETLRKGFANVLTPGRMERVSENPRVILSGDHNPAGIECLLQTLERLPPTSLHTVCAFSPDKPFGQMYERLKTVSESVFLTVVPRLREAMPPSYFEMGPVFVDPHSAIDDALKSMPASGTLLVTGSLYLVGEVRGRWKSEITGCFQSGQSS